METQTWTTESGKTYPLFPFDEPPVVTLPNGTIHKFRMWDEETEKRRENLLKTIIVTSGVTVNGENPRDIRTDFTRSALAYYEMMIDEIGGLEGVDGFVKAKEPSGETRQNGAGPVDVPFWQLVGAPIRKEAALRVYGGKIEMERPDADEEDGGFAGDPFAELDIEAEIERQKNTQKALYRLSLHRDYIIRHELGVNPIPGTGRFTDPTHLIRYHFDEPDGAEFSLWELKGHRGNSIPMKNGGERSERYYNLETVKTLYGRLINRIEGASLDGQPIQLPSDRDDPRRKAILERVPLAIKKLTVATLFNEMNALGNA